MDPAALIIGALAAGFAEAAKDVVVEEVPKAYQALKKLVISKLQTGANMKEEAAATLVEEYEQDPESWEGGLKSKLQKAPLNEQDEIVRQAQALLDLINQNKTTEVIGGQFVVDSTASIEDVSAKLGKTRFTGAADKVTGPSVTFGGSARRVEVDIDDVEVNVDDQDA